MKSEAKGSKKDSRESIHNSLWGKNHKMTFVHHGTFACMRVCHYSIVMVFLIYGAVF